MSCPGKLELAGRSILWGLGVLILIVAPAFRQTHWRAYCDLPTGRSAYLDIGSFPRFQWMFEHARPSDYVFGDPLLAFEMDLGDPAQVPYVTASAYTRPEQVRDVIAALQSYQVRFVFWYSDLDFREPDLSPEDNLPPLREYLRLHYHPVRAFGGSKQLLERNP